MSRQVGEIQSLHEEVYDTGYMNYSQRIITHTRQFARYNSSWIIIVGTISLVVLGGVLMYNFYDSAGDFLPRFLGGPDSSDKEVLSLYSPKELRQCVSRDVRKISIIGKQEDFGMWNETSMECSNDVKQILELKLSGFFSPSDLDALLKVVSVSEALTVEGPEICDYFAVNATVKDSKEILGVSNNRHLIRYLNISHVPENCGSLFTSLVTSGLLDSLDKVNLDNVTFDASLNNFMQKVLAKHVISKLSLTNIKYTN